MSGDGILGHHRKVHLPPSEAGAFTPGDSFRALSITRPSANSTNSLSLGLGHSSVFGIAISPERQVRPESSLSKVVTTEG